MKEITAALLMWISVNSGYEFPEMVPKTVLTDTENLIYFVLGEIPRIPPKARTALKGAYDPQTHTIWLRDDLDMSNQKDLSHLVHELVHYLQDQQVLTKLNRCEAELEAYEIQNQYLTFYGLDEVEVPVQITRCK